MQSTPIGRDALRTVPSETSNTEHLASAYWNTIYLGRAANHIRYSGAEIDEALLAHVSPLGRSQIGLTGDYRWEDASFSDGGGYRALHDPSGRLQLVA